MHDIWQAAVGRAIADWNNNLRGVLDTQWKNSSFERSKDKADAVIQLAKRVLEDFKKSMFDLCTGTNTPSSVLEEAAAAAKEITDSIGNWSRARISLELRTPHGVLRTDYAGALEQRLAQINNLVTSLRNEIVARANLGYQNAIRLESEKEAERARAVARDRRESREHWPKLIQSYIAVVSYSLGIVSLFLSFATGAFQQLQTATTSVVASAVLLIVGWLLQHKGRSE